MVCPGLGDLVVIGQPVLREELGIDVMTQLKQRVERTDKGGDNEPPRASALLITTPTIGRLIVGESRSVGQGQQEAAQPAKKRLQVARDTV